MSRGRKILLIAGGGLAGLIALVFIAGIIVVRTEWFRDTVRAKIVSAVEEGTGGKASIGAFAFDWTQLRVDIRNFVIHGLEPADAAPLFRASRIQVQLKAAALLKGALQLAYLGVDEPQANIIVFPDGRTNVPAPKVKKKSDKSALETVVDLAVGRFDLRNGSVAFADRKTALNASGRNLRAQLNYNLLKDSYTGELAVSPLYLKSGANEPVNVDVKLPVTLERDRIALADGRLSTPESELVVSGAIERLQDPRIKAHVNARISLDEVRRAAGINQLDTKRGPRVLTADITASMADQRIDIANARVKAGASGIEASGVLRDPRRRGNLQFDADLALGELAALMKSSVQPAGTVRIGGNAALTPDGGYAVTANVLGRGLEVRSGQTRIPGIDLNAAVSADPKRVALGGLRLSALGGSVTGSGAIENMQQLQFDGRLDGFDIGRVMAVFSPGKLGYTGVVSGSVHATGFFHI
jgi:translocation and assembly module TamB